MGNQIAAPAPVSTREKYQYDMGHRQRGLAFIFANFIFDDANKANDLSHWLGGSLQLDSAQFFQQLGFSDAEIIQRPNFTRDHLLEFVKLKLPQEGHSQGIWENSDMLALYFGGYLRKNSNGSGSSIICHDGSAVDIIREIVPLLANIPGMEGKPRLIIIDGLVAKLDENGNIKKWQQGFGAATAAPESEPDEMPLLEDTFIIQSSLNGIGDPTSEGNFKYSIFLRHLVALTKNMASGELHDILDIAARTLHKKDIMCVVNHLDAEPKARLITTSATVTLTCSCSYPEKVAII